MNNRRTYSLEEKIVLKKFGVFNSELKNAVIKYTKYEILKI